MLCLFRIALLLPTIDKYDMDNRQVGMWSTGLGYATSLVRQFL